jgi:hypothetical protein
VRRPVFLPQQLQGGVPIGCQFVANLLEIRQRTGLAGSLLPQPAPNSFSTSFCSSQPSGNGQCRPDCSKRVRYSLTVLWLTWMLRAICRCGIFSPKCNRSTSWIFRMETLFLGTLSSDGIPVSVLQRRLVFHRPFSNDRDHRFHPSGFLIGIT